jgi:hypothetical protein
MSGLRAERNINPEKRGMTFFLRRKDWAEHELELKVSLGIFRRTSTVDSQGSRSAFQSFFFTPLERLWRVPDRVRRALAMILVRSTGRNTAALLCRRPAEQFGKIRPEQAQQPQQRPPVAGFRLEVLRPSRAPVSLRIALHGAGRAPRLRD